MRRIGEIRAGVAGRRGGHGVLQVLTAIVTTALVAGAQAPGALADVVPAGASVTELPGKSVTEGHDKSVTLKFTTTCPDLDGYAGRECLLPWAQLVDGTADAGSDYVPTQLWMTGHAIWGFWSSYSPPGDGILFFTDSTGAETSTLYTGDSHGEQGIPILRDPGDTTEVFKLQFAVEVRSYSCPDFKCPAADDSTYYYEVPVTIHQGYKVVTRGSSRWHRLHTFIGKGLSRHQLANRGFFKVNGRWLYQRPLAHKQKVTLTDTVRLPVTAPTLAVTAPTTGSPAGTTPQPQPDLVVAKVYGSQNDYCSIYADIQNVGSADAPATKTEFKDGNDPSTFDIQVDTPAIGAGQTATVKLARSYGQNDYATVTADATNLVTESNENNNSNSGYGYLSTNGNCHFP